MPVDPQFLDLLAMLRAMPSLADIPIEVIRNTPVPVNPAPTPVDDVSERSIPGPGGELKVRIYRSGSGPALPLLLFFHGGGFVAGNLDTHDEMARVLTAETGCATVSVDYRLAPEHPFPAAPDDAFAALNWAAAQAHTFGADPGRIAVAGDSAGGNLAAVTALRVREEGGPALRGQILIYPAVDITMPLPPAPDGQYYVLSPREGQFFNRSYLPDPALAHHPYVSPSHAGNLRDLAPALIVTAEYDPLRSQGETYAAKLKADGVDTVLRRHDGAVHGFASFPVPMGRQMLRHAAEWLKARFA